MNGLLGGLEIAIVPRSDLEEDSRFDAQFFFKRYLAEDQALNRQSLTKIDEIAFVTDGPHGYHVVDEDSPIAMLTASCASDWFADRAGADTIAKWVDDANRRSSLEVDDLILSTRGTVGNCALVTEEALPANLDQDVARIAIYSDGPVKPRFAVAYLNSKFGQDHITRHASGMVQQGLSLAKVRKVPLPALGSNLQTSVAACVDHALEERRSSIASNSKAEKILLDTLGLAEWTPPEPLTYAAKASDAVAAGRLDARFFAPRIQALLDILSSDNRTISSIAKPRREKFRPEKHNMFDYIEISDMDGAGATGSTRLLAAEAPSRATWHVRPGDIITSSVRPIRRLSAQIMPEQNGFVCSSGFVVIDPQDMAPEVLLTYLRLPVICELLDLYASASMYPAITDADIFNLPMPELPEAVAAQIVVHAQNARAAKARAAALLDAAKRAVEVAIEESEAAALAYLATIEGAN